MSRVKRALTELFKFFPDIHIPKSSPETYIRDYRQYILIKFVLIIFPIIALFFSILNWRKGNIILAISEMLLGLLFIVMLFIMRQTKYLSLIRILFLCACSVFGFIVIINPLAYPTIFIWTALLPVMLFFFLGKRLGLLYSTIFLAIALAVFTWKYLSVINTLPIDAFGDILFCIIIISGLSYYYEVTRTEIEEELIKDIAERRRAEEALKKSEERYRTIFEEIEEGYYEVDLAGNFIFFNDSFAKVVGYAREEIQGMNYRQRIDERNVKNVYEAYNNLLKMKVPFTRIEIDFNDKNNVKRIIEASASLLKNTEGETIGFRGIGRDITDQKKAEEERNHLEERIHQSEKMEVLGKLAGGVAHDLNNILGVLVGYSELMLMEIPEDHPLRKHVSNIQLAGERAAAVIQDLLTLTRRGVATSEVVNLNKIISGYYETPEFESLQSYHSNIIFKTELDKDLMDIKGSPVNLSKTIMNLINNAAEAIADNGEVGVQTQNCYLDTPLPGYSEMKKGDYVILSVSDSGRGISAKDKDKLFEPFYTKKIMGKSGTGLGLSIVWGTVQDHKGYIDVQSEEGKGSSFNLYFPVTKEVQKDDYKKISPEVYKGNGETILVVDDVKEQRELATMILNNLGYKVVHAASSGEEAIEYLKTNKVDTLVLDMIMDPGIDGLETYKRALEINSGQKAVIISGFSETDKVKDAQLLGAGTYVKKPYLQEKLGLAIRKELNKS
jgi:two-component system cell cycle sensor histidine kinase/response regulator CckA